MSFAPLLDAPLAVQVHVASVVPAALLGAFLLSNPKGTPRHRLIGRIWFVLMVMTALSSFFIHSFDLLYGFSPIHLISLFVLYASWQAFQAARRGDIRAHRAGVVGMYVWGIGVAGLFTLLPERVMGRLLFAGGASSLLVITLVAAILVLLLPALRRWRGRRAV
ncbi:Uncharacterized membrane protein [Rhizobium sp. RU20A]|uniref:DUF2306 domain-containing protein n=1 Tax=Rhizobium sp. RU20A TaxID=1907412 RepID=UPI000954D227|nr:DUF2306 domain-containing protein [Rhizobium sp. RU20A]SIQ24894.1 Uncharacterized membrane protein [Rhizobium sp. RU20A]